MSSCSRSPSESKHCCNVKIQLWTHIFIAATNLCFAEKSIYTQEVLAVVMQQLMEQNPLPTLLMRTVIQSLAMYPRLVGFVMNILQRLIIKEVRKDFFFQSNKHTNHIAREGVTAIPSSNSLDRPFWVGDMVNRRNGGTPFLILSCI
jgi:hypothetical protein